MIDVEISSSMSENPDSPAGERRVGVTMPSSS
jgi:hypothetical protein